MYYNSTTGAGLSPTLPPGLLILLPRAETELLNKKKKNISSSSCCWDIKIQILGTFFDNLWTKMKQIHLETCVILTFWETNMTGKLLDDNSKRFSTTVLLRIDKS